MLFTKPIHAKKHPTDGTRVSVMSRHTLNDGKTPDKRIKIGHTFHEWHKLLSPPGKLVGAHYRGEISWPEFKKKYLEHLRKPEIAEQVKVLAKRALEENITIMCVEKNAEDCHRGILAEEMKRYGPDLKVVHK